MGERAHRPEPARKAPGFPWLVLTFALSILVMLAVLLLNLQIPQEYGLPLAIVSIFAIGAFSLRGLFEDSFARYFLWSCVIQVAYFFLDYGTAVNSGKNTWFAGIQLVNYAIAGTLFAFILIMLYHEIKKRKVYSYAGLYPKNQWLTLALVISCLSLGGLPAFNIFVGEFLMYSALMQTVPVIAMAAIFASLLAFLFYFRFIFTMFAGDQKVKIQLGIISKGVTAVLATAVVVLGVVPQILLYVLNLLMTL